MDIQKNTRSFLRNFAHKIRDKDFPLLIEAFKWLFIDIYRTWRYGKRVEFKDFYMLTGRRGVGKTLSVTKILYDYRKQFGDTIYITTNYGFEFEDFPLTHYSMIMDDYDKPIIFVLDEIQNQFDSRKWNDFPSDLFEEITQSRKKSKMLISTAQYYEMVDKKIRYYSDYVYEIQPIFGYNRWVKMRQFDRIDYERKIAAQTMPMGPNIPTLSTKFYVASDKYRAMYKTTDIVQKMKKEPRIPMKEKTFDPVENPFGLSLIAGDLKK